MKKADTNKKAESKKTAGAKKTPASKKTKASTISIVDLIDTKELFKDLPKNKKATAKTARKEHIRPSASIYMTVEEVLAVLEEIKSEKAKEVEQVQEVKAKKPAKKERKASIKIPVAPKKPLVAASIMDILGFNPQEQEMSGLLPDKDVPAKWREYYDALVALLKKYRAVVDEKSSEVLNKSVKEDSGDLSSYGQHQADVGSENFERDLAFTMLSEDKVLVQEIEAAISRIKDGTYGICEITHKEIPADRLVAIPYARYSIEGQIAKENEARKLKLGARQSIGEITDELNNEEDE
ncbi:MAG: TraR/DksA C4-type zinc finger protein [Opitutales bacterium]